MERCVDCKFAYEQADGPLLCRRFPPVVLQSNKEDNKVFSQFPPMLPSGWCGEFRAKVLQ